MVLQLLLVTDVLFISTQRVLCFTPIGDVQNQMFNLTNMCVCLLFHVKLSYAFTKSDTGCIRALMSKTDFTGNDISQSPIIMSQGSTALDCRENCTHSDGCQFFTFDQHG